MLDGIMTEVIALIFKEDVPRILSNIKYEDHTRVKRSINSIRTAVSKKRRLV